jgi:O-antigen/teichoic acid export membrane protein
MVLIPIARALDLNEYGRFTLILTTIGIAQTFSSLGLRLVVIREIARNLDNLSHLARKTLHLAMLGFFCTSIPLVLYLFLMERMDSPVLLAVSALLLLAQIIWNFAEPLAFGKEQMHFSSLIGSAFACIWIAAVFLFPAWIRHLQSLLAMFLLVQLARGAVYVFLLWREGYFRTSSIHLAGNGIGYRKLLTLSMPLYASSLLNALITQIPVLFLSKNSGPVEVAFFGVASKLSLPFVLLYSNLINAIYPFLARYYREKDTASFANRFKQLFLAAWSLGIGVCFLLSLFSAEIIRLLFGAKFAAASPAFAVLLWVTLNHLIHACMGLFFLAADKERLMVKLSVFNGIVTGAFAYFGSFSGATGLSLATLIGLGLSYLVHWHFVQGIAAIPIRKALLYCFYAAYLALGAGCFYFQFLSTIAKITLAAGCAALYALAYFKNQRAILNFFQAGGK